MLARHCVSGLSEAAETAATPGRFASRAVDSSAKRAIASGFAYRFFGSES